MTSGKPCVPSSEFLADRSLGRNEVPQALRAYGLVVHTLFSVYGDREQYADDPQWITVAGVQGWFVLTADKRIRYDVSTALLIQHQVGFSASNGNLSGAEQVRRFVIHLPALLAACSAPRPFICTVYGESGQTESLLTGAARSRSGVTPSFRTPPRA